MSQAEQLNSLFCKPSLSTHRGGGPGHPSVGTALSKMSGEKKVLHRLYFQSRLLHNFDFLSQGLPRGYCSLNHLGTLVLRREASFGAVGFYKIRIIIIIVKIAVRDYDFATAFNDS